MNSEDASKSAFRRALVRDFGIESFKTKEWIVQNCRVATKEIGNPDMCKLVESLLIAYYRPTNKLLNAEERSTREKRERST